MTRQPTPTISGADVERIVARDFPAATSADVVALLEQYGTEPWHREIDRVRAAALKLASGDFDRLRAAIETAKCDFRDVLALAEFPEYSRRVMPSKPIPDDERQRIIDADWKQFSEWLAR